MAAPLAAILARLLGSIGGRAAATTAARGVGAEGRAMMFQRGRVVPIAEKLRAARGKPPIRQWATGLEYMAPQAMAAPQRNAQAQQDEAQAREKSRSGLTDFAKKLGLAVGAIVGLNAAARRFSYGVLEMRREQAQYSAPISAMFARFRAQEIQLGIKTGADTAGTTLALGDSVMKLKEESQALTNVGINAVNLVARGAAIVARGMNNLAVALPGVKQSMEKVAETNERMLRERSAGGNFPVLKFLDDVAQGTYNGPKTQRPGVQAPRAKKPLDG